METGTRIYFAAMSEGLFAHQEMMASNYCVLWFSNRDRQRVHLECEETGDGL